MQKRPLPLFVGVTVAMLCAVDGTNAHARIATAEECARLPDAGAELACLREALGASQKALAQGDGDREASAPVRSPVPATPAPGPASTAVAAAPVRSADLGAEQVPQQQAALRDMRSADGVSAVIQAFRTDRDGLLVMRLDNGQIWRQTERLITPIALADGSGIPVEIARSGFGGYRMQFPELTRRIVVSRVK